MPTNYLEILNLFTADPDTSRRVYTEPFERDGLVVGTDGHAACCITRAKAGDIELPEPDPNLKTPNVRAILENIDAAERQEVSFKVSDLFSAEKDDRMKQVAAYCEHCDGTGEDECKCCGQSIECKRCDGQGLLSDLSPLVYRENSELVTFRVGSAVCSYKYVDRIRRACELADKAEVTFQVCGPNDVVTATAGELTFLIMPL